MQGGTDAPRISDLKSVAHPAADVLPQGWRQETVYKPPRELSAIILLWRFPFCLLCTICRLSQVGSEASWQDCHGCLGHGYSAHGLNNAPIHPKIEHSVQSKHFYTMEHCRKKNFDGVRT
jgi:hypothetical protein